MRRSLDGGKTFGELQSNITGRRSTNPSAVLLGEGKVLLFFNAPTVNLTEYRAMVAESTDAGMSFSTPRLVFDPLVEKAFAHVPTIVGPGSGAVVLPGGSADQSGPRIILSLYSHLKPPRLSPLPATSFLVGFVYSDTAGRTWNASTASIPYLGEPQLAALPGIGPQAVILNGRCADRAVYNHGAYKTPCEAGYRGIALSTDGGATFGSTVYDRQLQSPNCQGATVTTSGGALLYSGADSRETRMNMSVWRARNVTEWPPLFGPPTLVSPEVYARNCSSKSEAPCGAGYSALFASQGGGGAGLLWERGTGGCRGASCAIVLSWVQ